MSLVENVRTFVRFLKTGDKEYGEDILNLLEASPIRESNEYGFMLWAERTDTLRDSRASAEAQRTRREDFRSSRQVEAMTGRIAEELYLRRLLRTGAA